MPGADFTTGEPLPLGEAGEIVVHGPPVLTRYWKSTEATAAVPRDAQLHTGDIGGFDEKVTGIELLDSSWWPPLERSRRPSSDRPVVRAAQ